MLILRQHLEAGLAGEEAIEDVARKIAKETGGFTGGPINQFAEIGRQTLASLEANGVRPGHHVLDVGCGALRLGYWLVRYLDADRYCGIEPNKSYVDAGLKHAIGPDLVAQKRPRFDHSSEFDFSVFGTKFDFVIARSIFSHTPPAMMRSAMESFRDNSTDSAIMLASYKHTREGDKDADFVDAGGGSGREWGWFRYRPAHVYAMARECGLWADDWGKKFNGQVWLKVSRQPL
jgi:SAM-dependent methyltransferase